MRMLNIQNPNNTKIVKMKLKITQKTFYIKLTYYSYSIRGKTTVNSVIK